MALKFPLGTAFAEFHKFWYVIFSFPFMSKCILSAILVSSLTHWLLKSNLIFNFNFHYFDNFPISLLILIFKFVQLWSKNILCISLFLNLLIN